MSHTPGPWKLQGCSHGGAILVRGLDTREHPQSHLQVVPVEDAFLIAAAPDLLAALKELVAQAVTDSDACAICLKDITTHVEGCFIPNAEAAIARAEGRP